MAEIKKKESIDYCNDMMKKLKIILDSDKFCDVVLIAGIDGMRISAHRLILSAATEYFDVMFASSMRESTEREVTLFDISGEILQSLVTFCYTGELNLQEDNVKSILSSAHRMQLKSVVDQCVQYLKNQLSPSNCLGIQLCAQQYECTDLWEYARNYASRNFLQVIKSEEFFNLNVDQLSDLLSRDNLYVKFEENVFQCLMSWVQKDELNRKKYLPQLLPHIRMNHMDSQYISENVESVCKESGCIELITHAANTPEHMKRSYYGNGLLLGCDAYGNFRKYCPNLNEWTPIDEMKLNEHYYVFAFWENKLIAVGPFINGKDITIVQYWDVELKKWREISPLINQGHYTAVAVLGGSLYVMGNLVDQNVCYVACLDSLSGSWRSLARLPLNLMHIEVVGFEECIYAKGYMDDISMHQTPSFLCRYDPHTNIWTNLGELDKDIQSIFVANGKLYACGDILQVYNKNANTWTKYSTNRNQVKCLCTHNGRILTVTNELESWDLKEFDFEKNDFINLTNLNLRNLYRNIFSMNNM